MKKAVAYVRFSSDNQREESIDAQVRAITENCQNNNIELTKIYADEAISGRSVKEREQFLEMISDSKIGLFNFVIVHKLDRFARNLHDQVVYEKRLEDNGVKLISVTENLNDDPESTILKSLLIGMSQYYSENLSREVKKGQKENAFKSIHCGGIPPLGYDLDENKKLIINHDEAESIRLMFKLALEGYSTVMIAYTLNKLGKRNKKGLPFRKTSVRDNLMNIKYIGTYYWGLKDEKGRKQNKPIIKENSHEPIIDKETFYKVQLKFSNRKTGPRMRSERMYYLTGFCKCGECNGVYSGGYRSKSRNGDVNYGYECKNRKLKEKDCKNKPIRKEVLENYVFDVIKENILTNKNIDFLAKEVENLVKEKLLLSIKEKEIYEQKIEKVELMLSKLLDQFLEGAISKELFEKKKKELEKNDLFLKEKLFSLENIGKIKEGSVRNYLQNLKQGFKNLKTKRVILDTFVYNIAMYKEKIEVTLRRFPSSLDMVKNGGDDESRTRVRNY